MLAFVRWTRRSSCNCALFVLFNETFEHFVFSWQFNLSMRYIWLWDFMFLITVYLPEVEPWVILTNLAHGHWWCSSACTSLPSCRVRKRSTHIIERPPGLAFLFSRCAEIPLFSELQPWLWVVVRIWTFRLCVLAEQAPSFFDWSDKLGRRPFGWSLWKHLKAVLISFICFIAFVGRLLVLL